MQGINRLMFSNGVADLLTGLVLIPMLIREERIAEHPSTRDGSVPCLGRECDSEKVFIFSVFHCRLLVAITWLSITTSIYTFAVVSFMRMVMHINMEFYERYFSVEKSYMTILPCWVLGLAQAIPLLTDWNNCHRTDYTTCSMPVGSSGWIWTSAITVFIIPTITILISYGVILYKQFSESEDSQEAFKSTKVMLILTAAFLLCWWPTCIFMAVKWADKEDSRASYFSLFNSLINPLLLMYFNHTLRYKVVDQFGHMKSLFVDDEGKCRSPASVWTNCRNRGLRTRSV